MIRDGLLRDPEPLRRGRIPKLNREQAIAIFTSAEPQHVLMHRYGASGHVVVSIRGGRNYRQFTKYLKRGIRGFSRITPEQIKLIRTIPGSNRTTGSHWLSRRAASLGTADTDRPAFRTSFMTRSAPACRTSVFPIGRTRWRLPPVSIWLSKAPFWPPHGLTTRLIPSARRPCEAFRWWKSHFPKSNPDRHTQKSSAYLIDQVQPSPTYNSL